MEEGDENLLKKGNGFLVEMVMWCKGGYINNKGCENKGAPTIL